MLSRNSIYTPYNTAKNVHASYSLASSCKHMDYTEMLSSSNCTGWEGGGIYIAVGGMKCAVH